MIEANWKGKTGLLEDSQVSRGDQKRLRYSIRSALFFLQGSGLVARYGGSIKAMLADHFPSMFPELSSENFLLFIIII